MHELNHANVLLHEVNAAKGRNGHSTPLQEIEHDAEKSRGVLRWWNRYFRWEALTVAGRNIEKGFVISPQIAGILLVAILGMAGWAYKTSTADSRETRDAIIEMKTMLNERTRVFSEQQAKIESELKTEKNVAQLQREKADKALLSMKFALQQKGIQVTE